MLHCMQVILTSKTLPFRGGNESKQNSIVEVESQYMFPTKRQEPFESTACQNTLTSLSWMGLSSAYR